LRSKLLKNKSNNLPILFNKTIYYYDFVKTLAKDYMQKTKTIQIAIVEDDIDIRESLSLFIKAKTQYEVVLICDSVEKFLIESQEYPDLNILLLDIGLPGMSGLEGLPLIKKVHSSLDIIMLTTYNEVEIIFEALCLGACSYISKRTPLPKIIEALHVVSGGGAYMSPSIARKIAEKMQSNATPKKIELTTKQKDIVQLILDGSTYNEIAKKLEISVNTVRFHIKKVYSILEIGSKVELYKKFVDGEI